MIEYKQKLKVRGLNEVYDGLYGCPPEKAVSFFAQKDPDGVIALHRGIYYDPSSVRISERSADHICTFYRYPSDSGEARVQRFMDEFAMKLHEMFDTEEM